MKILMHFRHFPVAMGRFIHWGLQDLGHEVYTVGPYSAGRIPWGDFYYPDYKFPPNFSLQESNVSVTEVLKKIDFKPDAILQAGDSIWMEGKAPIPNFVLATDPHVVDYEPRREFADRVFSMQKHYAQPNDIYIPYAYAPYIHKVTGDKEKYDVVLCGLQYEHRLQAIEAMRAKNLSVFNSLGLVYEDYTKAYNKGKIAFVYSSKEDLPARFWEGLAMRRMVLVNRVPDLNEFNFKEDEDYVGFSSIEEAVEKAVYYAKHDRLRIKIAESGYKKVKPHTYAERARRIISCLK
jgi:hypothetical protein